LGKRLEHLGIIIDGNRRYAQRSKLQLEDAYNLGAQKVYDVIRYVFGKTDIGELSVYALSYDNILRKPGEVDTVIKAQKAAFDRWVNDPFFENMKIRVRFIGDLSVLPSEFRESCERLERKTSKNNGRVLNMLVAYMGHREISAAVEKVLKHKGITVLGKNERILNLEELISKNLDIKKPVDLVIRTANEHRFSGFLPWQTEYSELYVLDKQWPEIEVEDVERAITKFNEHEVKRGL
jgi:undecaprenyl diphosphate synthase